MKRDARRRGLIAGLTTLIAAGIVAATAGGAAAHGFSSVVYADVTAGEEPGHVAVELQLEYDLLVVSAADAQRVDALFRDGTAAFEAEDPAAEVAALQKHADAVHAYLDRHVLVSAAGAACTTELGSAMRMTQREGAPYVVLHVDAACPRAGSGHVITSTLFPDDEGYVTGTKTILTYALDLQTGSAALGADRPSVSTEQSIWERFWEFFSLGAEHLLTGIDHILFLLALIAGSRRLREIVLAATAFTVAHSVTFILAATGAIAAPASIIEPVIALSIAVVGAWYLWRLWRQGDAATTLDADSGPWGLDRAGWLRLGVVFVFGLVHGLGFASALGLDEPWSWTLLWSLLVFNLGIEAVQIAIIALVFPLVMLLRRRTPRLGLWATGALAVAVTLAGIIWFVQRVMGL